MHDHIKVEKINMSLTSGRDLTSPVTLQQRSHPLPIHPGVPRGHRASAGQMTELDQNRDSYIIVTLILSTVIIHHHRSQTDGMGNENHDDIGAYHI